ncbi:hypothetical protein PV10_02782 [Exophiala mesophila]|uniref:MutL C-terminal dimerisation domain-containing protein n=1 Tax=Exophiala mesophila TaxID=212818 RepID=A0A0D1X014_EXOME|nr:uncharacterized protein PV10_02782 [Exophiala mesophila]KIV95090.1 hypothetical protein PV10_02782 [Exophiala mesophila]
MSIPSRRIRPLPEQARAQICSSADLVSPAQILAGLVENALDADATSIKIHVNLRTGYFMVQDDGLGISEADFAEDAFIGQPYCSSKSDVTSGMYGRCGRFLAHLSTLSLLSIRSRCPHDSGHHRLVLQRGQVMLRRLRIQDDEFQGYGTNVQVYGLFAHLPVRSRQNINKYSSPKEVQKDFDNLKKLLVRYLLARPRKVNVDFSAQDCSQRFKYHCPTMAPQGDNNVLEDIVSILRQANLAPRLDASSWNVATLRMNQCSIWAAFSLDPSPSKSNQFISLGIVPVDPSLGGKWLYDQVNDMFDKSTYSDAQLSLESSSAEDDSPQSRGRSGNKIDRWPMFSICIDIQTAESQGRVQPELLSTRTTSMQLLSQALIQLVSQFLDSHGLKTKPTRRNLDWTTKTSPQPQGRLYSPTSETPAHRRFHPHLQHWHRVKSGRHLSQERGDHGLPFTKRADFPASPGLAVQKQTSNNPEKANEAIGTIPLHPTTHETNHCLSDDQAAGVDDSAISWTDPQTNQSTRVCSRTGRTLDSTTTLTTTGRDHGGPSTVVPRQRGNKRSRTNYEISTILRQWSNQQGNVESPIQQLTERCVDESTWNSHCGLHASSGSVKQVPRASLSCAEVLGQVDRKFLLAVTPSRGSHGQTAGEHLSLLVIDQHAADERVKLEKLCHEFFASTPVTLAKPLVFEVDQIEAELFKNARDYFGVWHICYSVERVDKTLDGTIFNVTTSTLPMSIAERCRAEPGVLIELLRGEVWKEDANYDKATSIDSSGSKSGSWISFAAQCPPGILELLKSRSCRTAIMFNDILDKEQGQQLVDALSRCDLPFQCAHGRPTMAIVAELDSKQGGSLDDWIDGCGEESVGFGVAWQGWKEEDSRD